MRRALARVASRLTRPDTDPLERATVTRIIDGDTLDADLDDGSKVTIRVIRIPGIDTPETYRTPEFWGSEATQYALDELDGERVILLRDPTQDDRDRYGRLLRDIIYKRGVYSVNAAAAGAARSYVYRHPVQLHAAIKAAEQLAKDARRGMWSARTDGVP